MFTAKKLVLIILTLCWIMYPNFASSAHKGVKKTSHHKTQIKHSTLKKHPKKIAKSSHQTKVNTKKKHGKHTKKSTKRHKKSHDNQQCVRKNQYPAQIRSEDALPSPPPASTSFVSSIGQRLVNFVKKSVDTFRYSAYKMGGSHIDTSHGIYVVDCSGYVDHTLRAVFPKAYFSLVDSSGTSKPNTMHYYDFFKGLAENPDENWNQIDEIAQLEPGDILVFRQKQTRRNAGGHVMVVMDKPIREGDTFWVSVADSAPVGHSEDTRQRNASGIGIGTLLLKMNPQTGEPSAYAWGEGSSWKKNVNFAMARPVDSNSRFSAYN